MTRPTWKRTSAATWTAEGFRYAVCMNDSGRSFRVMLRKADGYLHDLPSAQRFRTLEGAQNVAEALEAQAADRT